MVEEVKGVRERGLFILIGAQLGGHLFHVAAGERGDVLGLLLDREGLELVAGVHRLALGVEALALRPAHRIDVRQRVQELLGIDAGLLGDNVPGLARPVVPEPDWDPGHLALAGRVALDPAVRLDERGDAVGVGQVEVGAVGGGLLWGCGVNRGLFNNFGRARGGAAGRALGASDRNRAGLCLGPEGGFGHGRGRVKRFRWGGDN